jgi:GNAT superfamily N-acetyltransferase
MGHDDFDDDGDDAEASRLAGFHAALSARLEQAGLDKVGELVVRDADENDAEFLELHQITVKADRRRNGYGGRMLDVLTALADEYGVEIELEAAPNMDHEAGGLGRDELVKFYEAKGFTPLADGKMVRLPVRGPTPSR